MDDGAARHALEAAAQHADKAAREVPYLWNGASWTTPGGEWRDFPLIRRGMGEWLVSVFKGWQYLHQEIIELTARRESLLEESQELRIASLRRGTDPGAQRMMFERAKGLMEQAHEIPPYFDAPVSPEIIKNLETVATELLSATDARATQLLSLASQFDTFRAPMRDPAQWVSRLVSAPRSAHVRTSLVWEAFSASEPVLARSLGVRTGKRLLFAAMDRRFGARRKLAGYEGWRGVALGD